MKVPPLADLEKLRTELITSLERLFGKSKESDGRVDFENATHKAIAAHLWIDPSHLSRFLKSFDLREDQRPSARAYRKRIKQVKLLASLTKRPGPGSPKKNGIKTFGNALLLGLILGTVLTLAMLQWPETDDRKKLIPLAITETSQVRNIMERNSLLITNQLVTGAYAENRELQRKADQGKLSDELKVQSMTDMQTAITVIMKGQRDGLRKVNYQVGGSKNIADFIDEKFPLGRLFNCTPEVLALAESLPDSAYAFDRSLFNMRTLVFDPDAQYEDFNRQITQASKIVQNRMRDLYLVEVECFLNSGVSCK